MEVPRASPVGLNRERTNSFNGLGIEMPKHRYLFLIDFEKSFYYIDLN